MDEKQPARVIKRYTNRKLYDTRESRYVTLEEISTLVKAGEEVQILDNRSNKDLTEVTLAQILYEEQKKQSLRMPLQALKDLIRTRGAGLTEFFQKRITQPVQTLKEGAGRTVDQLVRRSESTVDQLRELIQSVQRGVDEVQHRVDERFSSLADGSRVKLLEQVQGLRRRIEEIESRLKKQNS